MDRYTFSVDVFVRVRCACLVFASRLFPKKHGTTFPGGKAAGGNAEHHMEGFSDFRGEAGSNLLRFCLHFAVIVGNLWGDLGEFPAKHPNNCLHAFEVPDWLPLARASLSLQTVCLLLVRLNTSVSAFVSVHVSVYVPIRPHVV